MIGWAERIRDLLRWRLASRDDLFARLDEAKKARDDAQIIKIGARLLARRHLTAAERLRVLGPLARAKLNSEDAAGALSDCDAALAIDPARADEWYDRGIALHKLHRNEAAAESFDRAAMLAPDEKTHIWRTVCRFACRDIHKARAAVEDALRLDPYHVEALQWRAHLRWEADDREGAVEDFTSALVRARSKKMLHRRRGTVLAEMGRNAEAIRDFDAYLASEPGDAEIITKRADLRRRVGDITGSIEDYGRRVKLVPDDFESRMNLVVLLCDTKRLEEALDEAKACVTLYPDNAHAHHVSARAHRLAGQFDQARKAIEKAISLEPQVSTFALERVHVLIGSRQKEAAIDALADLIDRSPQQEELRYSRGELHREMSHFRLAVADFDEVLRLRPAHVGAWTARARCHLSLDKPYLAMADIKQALKLAPADPIALVIKGNVHMYLEEVEPSFAHYDQALSIDPRCFEAMFYRATLSLHLGRLENALADYNGMVALDPGNGWIRGERGKLHFIIGNFQNAEEDFDAAATSSPHDADREIWSYFAHRRAHEVAVLTLPDPDGWPGIILRFMTGERTAEDISTFAQEVERSRGNKSARAQAAFYLAELILAKGDRAEATALFRRAVELATQASATAMRLAALAELSRIASSGSPTAGRPT